MRKIKKETPVIPPSIDEQDIKLSNFIKHLLGIYGSEAVLSLLIKQVSLILAVQGKMPQGENVCFLSLKTGESFVVKKTIKNIYKQMIETGRADDI